MKHVVVFFLIWIMMISCKQNEKEISTLEDQTLLIIDDLQIDLEHIGIQLRENEGSIHDRDLIKEISENVIASKFGKNSNELNSFNYNYNYSMSLIENSDARSVPDTIYVSQFVYDLMHEVTLIWSSVSTPAEYLNGLYLKLDEVLDGNLYHNDKESAVNYLSTLIVSTEFLILNSDLVDTAFIEGGRVSQCSPVTNVQDQNQCDKSWWDSWGKCATGTLGGVVSGAGTLGFAGIAAGSLVPGVGNVTVGAIGAIIGAVGGGLTGAATFCSGHGNDEVCTNMACPYIEIKIQ